MAARTSCRRDGDDDGVVDGPSRRDGRAARGRRPGRARPHRRLRKRGTASLSEPGIAWTSGGAKLCAVRPSPRAPQVDFKHKFAGSTAIHFSAEMGQARSLRPRRAQSLRRHSSGTDWRFPLRLSEYGPDLSPDVRRRCWRRRSSARRGPTSRPRRTTVPRPAARGGVGFGCIVYFALPLIHFPPGSLRDSVPLFPKRQCE